LARYRSSALKDDCARRILEVLDIPTVSNIQGAFLTGELTLEEQMTFNAGRKWVAAMQEACRSAIASGTDPVWPEVPDGVHDLAAVF